MEKLGFEFENEKGLVVDAGAHLPNPIKDAKWTCITPADIAVLAASFSEKEYDKYKTDQYHHITLFVQYLF